MQNLNAGHLIDFKPNKEIGQTENNKKMEAMEIQNHWELAKCDDSLIISNVWKTTLEKYSHRIGGHWSHTTTWARVNNNSYFPAAEELRSFINTNWNKTSETKKWRTHTYQEYQPCIFNNPWKPIVQYIHLQGEELLRVRSWDPKLWLFLVISCFW